MKKFNAEDLARRMIDSPLITGGYSIAMSEFCLLPKAKRDLVITYLIALARGYKNLYAEARPKTDKAA